MRVKLGWSASLLGTLCLCLQVSALGQNKSWQEYIQVGDDALAQSRYADSEQAYREALKLAEKLKGKDPRVAASLIKLAEAVSLQSKQAEAETYANRALVALDAALKSSKSKNPQERFYKLQSSATVFEKAARIFEAGQKHAEAEVLYKKLIVLREEAVKPREEAKSNEDFLTFLAFATTNPQADLADAYDRLATLYLKQRKFPEAETFYDKASKALEARVGPDDPLAAIALGRLATVFALQEKPEKAEPLYAKAIRILENADPFDRPQVAILYENYSLLLRKTGRAAEAATMTEKAKAIRSRIQSKSHE